MIWKWSKKWYKKCSNALKILHKYILLKRSSLRYEWKINLKFYCRTSTLANTESFMATNSIVLWDQLKFFRTF